MVGKPLTINELAALPRWVAWQNEPDPTDPARAPRKRPYSPKGGSAKADDPATWGTRREAETAAEKLPMPLDAGGTGFELGDIGNGLSIGGIDLDTCRDEDSGAFTPWAAEVLLKFSSYAEVSPSGHGAKIFFAYATADLPAFRQAMGGTSGRRWSLPGTNNHPPGIEIYLAGRYFAVTYARVDSTPIEIKTIDTATVLWVINDAGPRLVPAQPAISTASRDNSRSAIAYRLGWRVKARGGTYDEMRRVLRTDQTTAQWYKEKGDDRQLRRIWDRTSEPEAPLEEVITLNEWDVHSGDIPPRGWLLANTFCRGFVSALIADGGVGKTALRIAQLLSLATARPLTGQHIFRQCRVLFISLEDDEMELRRRIRAACIHHGIEPAELSGWFYAATPRGLKIAEAGEYGDPKLGSLDEGLRQTIARLGIDVVSLDPFVKAHGVEENANNAIDFVADALARIALECNCAVDAPHHISKGGGIAGDADKARGASAFKDAARLVYTLTPMTAAEAEMFGIIESERRSFVRLDSAKVNIAPPSDKAQWFRLVGVSLDNGNADYPNGDDVQSIEPWEPPDAWANVTQTLTETVLRQIDAGLPDGRRYSSQGKAKKDQQAWCLIVKASAEISEGQAKQLVRAWLQKKLLAEKLYHDPIERKDRLGLIVAQK